MDKIIGAQQSAFISGRNILDGVAILNEVIEEAKSTKRKRLFFKVDFAKAYDSIDWDFLDLMMNRMNFPEKWRAWIREGLSTASANVLVNGSPSGEFRLERGVRQGDPLSPFLFLIVAEGLNILIERAVARGLIGAVEVGREKVSISHIQYADDTLFIVDGTMENAKAIKWLLKNFELMSGLVVNFDKCSVTGLNLDDETVNSMAATLGCQVGCFPIPYLGVSVGGGAKRLANWEDVVSKVKRRLMCWDAQKISLGGRITLVNAVLAAIPIYRMSTMKMPMGTAKYLRSLQRNFLWGRGDNGNRKTAWIKWGNLCKARKDGGLGFRDLEWFNEALLGKWIWRFMRESNSLWARVVKSRHGPIRLSQNGIMLEQQSGRKSGWWRGLVNAMSGESGRWFWDNLKRKIGDGATTSFWEENWTGSGPLRVRFPRLFNLCSNKNAMVGDFGRWSEGRWVWDVGWRRGLLDRERESVSQLMAVLDEVVISEGVEDEWRWEGKPDGMFRVKLAYEEIAKARENEPSRGLKIEGANLVWKANAPFKSQTLAWRVMWDRLPTRENLAKRKIIPNNERHCMGCGTPVESAVHVLLWCPGVAALWGNLVRWVGARWVAPANPNHHLRSFAQLLGGGKNRNRLAGLWICAIDVIWRWRNRVLFEGWSWEYRKIESEIKCKFWGWCMAKGLSDLDPNFLLWTNTPLYIRWLTV